MDEFKKGEIAFYFLKYRANQNNLKIMGIAISDIELEREAKLTGVTIENIRALVNEIRYGKSTLYPEKKNEISLLYLKKIFREEGIIIAPNIKETMKKIIKNVGAYNLSMKEIKDFAGTIIGDLLEEYFK